MKRVNPLWSNILGQLYQPEGFKKPYLAIAVLGVLELGEQVAFR